MNQSFSPGSKAAAELQHWWRSLSDDRGARAELRRGQTLLDVMLTPAFHAARRRLIAAGLDDADCRHERLAAVLALAAHIQNDGDLEPAAAFSEGEKPPVSPLRFRRILEARSDEELFVRLRRVLPLVDQRINLIRLANDVLGWNDTTRKRWAYAYRWPQKQPA